MLDHYKELLGQFWRRIAVGAVVAGGLALVMSIVMLKAMPAYEASVTLNMQPSEEELRFNSGFLGVSQFNPATIIAQTHIERLLSRKVAGRAIDILTEEADGNAKPPPPSAFKAVKAAIWRWYNILNFGYFTPLPERETAINDLIGATEVEIVEGSYIIMVSVVHDDPELATRAVNALSRAYVEATREEFHADAMRVDGALDDVIAEREATLARDREERQATASRFGVADLGQERTLMLESRSTARISLQDAEVELALLDTRLASLRTSIAQASDAEQVRQLRQTLADTDASRAANEARLTLQRDRIAQVEQGLRDLDSAEDALTEIEQRIAEAETDILALRNRRVAARIAREAQLSQIRTIDTARVPVYPSSPKVLVNTIVATVLGGLLVALPVVAMDVLGKRIRTTEDLRRSFGSRTLPPVTTQLLRQARAHRAGSKPSPALQEFADALGRQFVSHGLRRWPSGRLFVTALGSTDDVVAMRDIFAVAARIAAPDGGAPEVAALPPLSRIADWAAYDSRHVIVGLRPATVEEEDLKALGINEAAGLYATLLP